LEKEMRSMESSSGVGSGTVIENVEVSEIKDDGIEWFGGL